MLVPVFVQCDPYNRKIYKWPLWRLGLHWNGENGFEGNVSQWCYEKINVYCHQNHLKFQINNTLGVRSSDYRRAFFRTYKPQIGKYYICAYCGKLLSKKKLTVDHIYPIGCAKKSLYLQKKLHRMGIDNINDPKNLVAACRTCNRLKSKKMGLWIIRGKLGRSKNIWLFRYLIRITVIVLVVYLIYTHKSNIIINGILTWMWDKMIWIFDLLFKMFSN